MLQAGALVDAGGEHHHRALVEDDLQLEPLPLDLLQHRRLVRHAGGDDHAPGGEGHARPSQCRREAFRRRLGQGALLLPVGQIEERAVLRHHRVEEIDTGEDLQEVFEVAAGDQEQLAPARPQPLQRLLGSGQHAAVVGQRLVVIGGKGGESHGVQGKPGRGWRLAATAPCEGESALDHR
ncbi:MAG TPA: hypothetical protein VF994_15460 [Myxococcales bacterium]